VAKPLQVPTWLLLTAYRKLLALYLIVPSPTPKTCSFATIHLWQTTTDRQTDERQPCQYLNRYISTVYISTVG